MPPQGSANRSVNKEKKTPNFPVHVLFLWMATESFLTCAKAAIKLVTVNSRIRWGDVGEGRGGDGRILYLEQRKWINGEDVYKFSPQREWMKGRYRRKGREDERVVARRLRLGGGGVVEKINTVDRDEDRQQQGRGKTSMPRRKTKRR